MIKGIKGKLALTMATTALGATLLAGGSFALFTSTTTNAGNTFTAGKVTITDYTGHAAFASTLHFSNLAPGDAEDATITVKNEGNLAEWVKITDVSTGPNYAAVGAPNIFGGSYPLAITFTEDNSKPVLIEAGASATLHVHYNFPSGADNSYQQAQGLATVNIQAVQARNNTTTANDGPLSW
jgi:spore coat-associated protein N